MKNSIYNFVLVLLSGITLSGCHYDNEAELYGTTACDTTAITYANSVAPIISSNCLQCHSQAAANGGVILEGHARLKTYADNGKLRGVINHNPGFVPMPIGAQKLSNCDIAKIEKWIAEGSLNN